MNIRVHIERLILDGLPAGGLHSRSIGHAAEAELTRLLAANSMTSFASRHEAYSSPTHLKLVRPDDSTSVGTQIGGAVYQVLNHTHHAGQSCP